MKSSSHNHCSSVQNTVSSFSVQGLAGGAPPPPPPPGSVPPPPPNFKRDASPGPSQSKGVLKLHWKPTSAEPPPVPALKQKGTFWNGLDLPKFDPQRLVQLFESKQPKEQAVKAGFWMAKVLKRQFLETSGSQTTNPASTVYKTISAN